MAAELELLFGAAGAREIVRADDMAHAVRLADAIARELLAADPASDANLEPATVLLSPAAANFDMFVDYAARGETFKEEVRRLAEEHRSGEGGSA